MTWMNHLSSNENTSPRGFSCEGCMKPLRCCDFTPFFPNFLVGFGMEHSSQAKEIISQMDLERLHPLGLLPGPSVGLPGARHCDFFSEGICVNWPARPSECSSYFCSEGLEKVGAKTLLQKLRNDSQTNFEFEFLTAQRAIKHMGHSLRQISAWVDEWNLWITGKKVMENSWKLSRNERLEFFEQQWRWLQTQSVDLFRERCQAPESVNAALMRRLQILEPGTL